jgi:hypothetical protein
MIPRQMKDFMNKLMQVTDGGEINWHEGAEGAYFASQKDAELHIRYFFDADTGEISYQFRIIRGNGDAVFSVMNEEDDFKFMTNLYSVISINAAGGESIVEDLFD